MSTGPGPDEIPLNLNDLPLFSTPEPPRPAQPAQHLAAAIASDSRQAMPPTHTATSSADPAAIPTIGNHTADPAAATYRRSGEIDWGIASALRSAVSDRLSTAIAADSTLDGEARLELGRAQIIQVLRDHVDNLVRSGQAPWDEAQTEQMQKAVFDSLFRLGRLQQHVDDPRVENVMVFGHDQVFVDFGGGQIEQRGPIADSDQQLIEDIQFLASRDGERGRPFSASAWKLSLSLPTGERLQATHPPIVPRPTVIIRRHPMITITLKELVERGTLTPAQVAFLSSAVAARKSIVVSGMQGAGKTTLLRALAHEIPPLEHIVTIETERELHLDRSGLHPMVTPLEARPGQGEPAPDGSRPGEVTLEELLVETLRMNTQRIIVGEVRGPEMTAMIRAMQAGAGTMSTLHAVSPADAIGRMAELLTEKLGSAAALGYGQIGQHIDFIVQLSNHLGGSRTLQRFVSEISEITPGEGAKPIAMPIFKATPGEAVAHPAGRPLPETLVDLVNAGFDQRWLFPDAQQGSVA